MEGIGPLVIGILITSTLAQLLWAHALSVIARKTDQGSLMEVLAWIPLAQLAPMLAVGGASLPGFLIGSIGLVVANVALIGAAAFLGEGIGGLLAALGLGLTALVCLGYYGRILWNTATARELPGWVGLLMFVPLVNLIVYPIIAFHDGWAGPHKIGMMLGFVITLSSMAPYIGFVRMMESEGGFPAQLAELAKSGEFDDIRQFDAMSVEFTPEEASIPGTSPSRMPSKIARDHERSIRALFDLKGRFEALAAMTSLEQLSSEDQRTRALEAAQSLRMELESRRNDLDPEIYDDLVTHLIRKEALIHVPASKPYSGGITIVGVAAGHSVPLDADLAGPAAMQPLGSAEFAPVRPFPVQAEQTCPTETELRSRTGEKGEEEWCQQLPESGGLRHGWYARYFEGGQPEQVGEYQEGLRVGVWTRFYASGQVRAQAQFADGLQHGWLLSFDRSGGRSKARRFDQGTAVR